MHPDVDAEFERTAPIGHAVNALSQAEDAVGSPIPPDVADRLDALIGTLTRE